MKKLVKQMVTALVDHPREVRITEIKGDKSIVYELRCHGEDVGKVIGRSGKTVGAMRTLLGAIAARDGRRAMLEVVE
ncbi:MAG: uncharacterized protein PWQ29_1253 [Verrucomicrobiota bacterium]|nr:uncharacterized protein [Verrucomicrobiota bacterium]MDK2963859.1 uncharacterized protein [Verrucomicrobiota bacterium]